MKIAVSQIIPLLLLVVLSAFIAALAGFNIRIVEATGSNPVCSIRKALILKAFLYVDNLLPTAFLPSEADYFVFITVYLFLQRSMNRNKRNHTMQ